MSDLAGEKSGQDDRNLSERSRSKEKECATSNKRTGERRSKVYSSSESESGCLKDF